MCSEIEMKKVVLNCDKCNARHKFIDGILPKEVVCKCGNRWKVKWHMKIKAKYKLRTRFRCEFYIEVRPKYFPFIKRKIMIMDNINPGDFLNILQSNKHHLGNDHIIRSVRDEVLKKPKKTIFDEIKEEYTDISKNTVEMDIKWTDFFKIGK